MASTLSATGRTNFSSATKGMVSTQPVSPKATQDSFNEIKAKRADNAERIALIMNTMGQIVGQKLNVTA